MPDALRVALVAPLVRPVAHDAPSSIEQIVATLADELVARGHDVTLFASGNSRSGARLRATYPLSYGEDQALWRNWQFHELMHAAQAFLDAERFDVLHSHVYCFPAPLAELVATPVVHTDHVPPEADLVASYARHPRATVVALSAYHRRKLAALGRVPVVPNGIDFERFPFSRRGGDHLLFLGHLISRKGPREAIEVARRAGRRLVLAGRADEDHFARELAPHVDGDAVEWVGPVDARRRDELLADAGALVFTSATAEPFGLVLVEAMACGTPVVALDRCAVPEIVEPGITGCVAADPVSLAALVPEALALDRRAVRARAAARFSAARMADGYEALYRRLVEAG